MKPILPRRLYVVASLVAALALLASCSPTAATPAATATKAPVATTGAAAATTTPAPTVAAAATKPAATPAATPAAGASPAASGKPVSLGMVIKNLVNPYFVTVQKGAENAAKNNNATIRVLAPSTPDNVDQQIQLMESLVQSRVDGVILTPADSKALVPAVDNAKKANIPVFTADTRIIGTDVMTFVGADHLQGGKVVGQLVVDIIKNQRGGKQANVIILEGVPGASSSIDRMSGSGEIFKANAQLVNVLGSMAADYNRVKAVNVTENLLTRFPNADFVLALNDEMALGAIEAIKARGKVPGKDILVVGMNAAQNALEAMQKGELAGTVYGNEYCMGYKAVEAAVAYLRNGTKPPADILLGESALLPVTQGNLQQVINLRAEQTAGAVCR